MNATVISSMFTRKVLMCFVLMAVAAVPGVVMAQESEAPAKAEESRDPVWSEIRDNDRPVSDAWKTFSDLPLWEDGLSEMSYYDAKCVIYDKERTYTRVHLMNRQFMNTVHYIKAAKDFPNPTPAFKFVIAEEVPTENYNYRFLLTSFFERPSLRPIKVSASSQEWCGHVFKQLMWERRPEVADAEWSLDVTCYSYHDTEGDRWFPFPKQAHIEAHEGLFLQSRAVVAAGGEPRAMLMLKTMRSNHHPDPTPLEAILQPAGKTRKIKVPLGEFEAQRVELKWDGAETWFDIETSAPWRLLAFKADDVEGELRLVERRAYWDRSKKSKFYKQGEAP